jgi:hypothetical protein
MGLYGGGGGTTVNYQPPVIEKDTTFRDYLQYQKDRETRADERAATEKKERDDAAATRRTRAAQGYSGIRSSIENQLNQGLITYTDALSQLRDYGSKNDLAALTEGGPNIEQDVADLTNKYTKEILPGRRATGIASAYKEMYGREAKEEEKAAELEKFNQGYYSTVQDLKDALAKSTEYQNRFNDNYLDNYYDTQFGSSVADRTEEVTDPKTGEKKTRVTKLRRFKFDPSLLPKYADTASLEQRSGVAQPDYEKFFGEDRSVEELQQGLQGVADTRKYLYSAGLTNLQGEIDKETQKLKNEGSKEVAKISSFGNVASNLVSGFWS